MAAPKTFEMELTYEDELTSRYDVQVGEHVLNIGLTLDPVGSDYVSVMGTPSESYGIPELFDDTESAWQQLDQAGILQEGYMCLAPICENDEWRQQAWELVRPATFKEASAEGITPETPWIRIGSDMVNFFLNQERRDAHIYVATQAKFILPTFDMMKRFVALQGEHTPEVFGNFVLGFLPS